MWKSNWTALLLALAALLQSTLVQAQGQDVVVECDQGCCNSWFADFEAGYMQYHRNDNFLSDNFFAYEFAPRLTVGVQNCEGFGVRARYWEYDQNGTGNFNGNVGAVVAVDTYNIDLELFQNVPLVCGASARFSGGMRYTNFSEVVTTAAGAAIQSDFSSGFGGVFGIEAQKEVMCGAIYARWNNIFLMDDHLAVNGHGLEFDQTLTQSELSLGYEWSKCLCNGAIVSLRGGVEWSNWTNFAHDNADPNDNTDVGFTGFVFGGAVQY